MNTTPPNKLCCILLTVVLGAAGLILVACLIISSALSINARRENADGADPTSSENSELRYATEMNTTPASDAAKFATEYPQVSEDNVFVYKTGRDIINILEHGTGVVFLGFPSCPWCQAYANYLNEVAKENGIEKIYYHNIYDDWQNNTPEYQEITEILSEHLQYNNEGEHHLYVPDTVFVMEGEILGNNYETSKDTAGASTPAEYWTEARVAALKSDLTYHMQQLLTEEECDFSCDR